MRVIKFRAWIDSIIGGYMAVQGEPDLEILGSFMHHYSDCKNLMQFTGLYDKSGLEIYEGDILQNESKEVFVVKWKHGGWIDSTSKEDYSGIESPLMCNNDNVLEHKLVIGNIYENPELL